MPDTTLKEKLINKLKDINNPAILDEVSNLFEMKEPETIFQVNDLQRKAIEEAKNQIRNNQTFALVRVRNKCPDVCLHTSEQKISDA